MTHIFVSPACYQSTPLGMITGDIQDWQITASSSYPQEWDEGCHERYGRIYQPDGHGWCAKYKSSSEWLQVYLGVAAKVSVTLLEGTSMSLVRSDLDLNTFSSVSPYYCWFPLTRLII